MADNIDYDEEYSPGHVRPLSPAPLVNNAPANDVDYDDEYDPFSNNASRPSAISSVKRNRMPESGIPEDELSELEDDSVPNKKRGGNNKVSQPKSAKPKRAAKTDIYEREAQADADADWLQKQMIEAINNDLVANQNGQPALHKFNLLPKLISIFQKKYNHEALLEVGILQEVRLFLEPLPDASLPLVNIQSELITLLDQLPITTDYLRSSFLGRIIKFYANCPRITSEVRKAAKSLLSKWTQNIMRQTGNYRQYQQAMDRRINMKGVEVSKPKISESHKKLLKSMSQLKASNRKR